MALKCSLCLVVLKPHCPSLGCGWVSCPKHGNMRVSAARRRKTAEEAGDASDG